MNENKDTLNSEEMLSEGISAIGAVATAVSQFITSAGKVTNTAGNFVGRRDFNDLNKQAKSNALTMYALVSSSVPTELYKSLSKGMETKIAALIKTIAANYIGSDIEEAAKYIKRNLTDSGYNMSLDQIAGALGDVQSAYNDGKFNGSNALAATRKLTEDLQIDLGESLLTEVAPTSSVSPSTKVNVESSNNVFMSPGNIFSFDIVAANKNGDATKLSISLMVRVNLIEVDSDKLVSAMIDAREHDNFEQYLKARARGTSFFKDVVMNMQAIDAQVKRDTSRDMQDRLIGELISKAGKTSATAGLFNTELRKFTVFLDISDLDVLSREHNLVITKGGTLHTMFKNMNMLSLCVTDIGKRRMTMFDSDRPLEMQVYPLDSMANEKRMMEMFSKVFN